MAADQIRLEVALRLSKGPALSLSKGRKKRSPWPLPHSRCREDARGSRAGPFGLHAGDVGIDVDRSSRRRHRRRVRLAVDQLLQFLPGLEVGHLLRRNVDLVTRLGIPALARLATPQPEAAKSPPLDLLASMQRIDDALEDRVDDDLGMLFRAVVNG